MSAVGGDDGITLHESLAKRIVVRFHLAGLAREELPEYLTHRLRLASCELPLIVL